MELWAAVLTGVLGSLHCMGMCGPIVLALPGDYTKKVRFLWGRLLYNSGRILSYAAIGTVLGLFGRGINLFGFQRYLSISLGVLILASVVLGYTDSSFARKFSFIRFYTEKIKSLFSKYIRNESFASMLTLGMLNGLLPCGLVYVAAAGAVITSDAVNSALYMALFGIGTLPLMLFASVFGRVISLNVRRKLNRFVPYFISVMAFILILRGLNLGIPMISPKGKNNPPAVKEHPVQNSTRPPAPQADCCE